MNGFEIRRLLRLISIKHFAFEVTAGSNRKRTFVCPVCKKEFEAKICSVTIAVCPCPYCRKVKKARRNSKPIVGVNDLASQCPQAVAMWSEKNKCYPTEVFAQSTKTAIFNCPKCKHEFETTVTSFVKSIKKSKGNTTGCPICNGTKVVVGYNDLATTCPQVAAMLSKKNAGFATKYTMGSNAVASFTCPDCKKEFEAKICKVTNVVYPCPYCRDTKILYNFNNFWHDANYEGDFLAFGKSTPMTLSFAAQKASLRSLAGALLVFSKTLNSISLNSDSTLFGVAQLGPAARCHGGRTQ